jgi:hypothetical protein
MSILLLADKEYYLISVNSIWMVNSFADFYLWCEMVAGSESLFAIDYPSSTTKVAPIDAMLLFPLTGLAR